MPVGRVLVDTSVFVDYFRDGRDSLLPSLVLNDEITLSQVVRLELIKAAGSAERRVLQNFLEGLIVLEELPPALLVEKNLLLPLFFCR